ncbi:hypothetical protein QWY87_13590 [Lutimonas halocynthiae]|uniref:hypothetical protein n=1 Tax=Lutimonas halocynthiae TaxID=1446477 RepID=UPI0025B5BADF|nr:hypothetical protein [Lutimonas halocynthiae]MDN3643744.1 hypothetical protein [Lutimonas halocynthiae]
MIKKYLLFTVLATSIMTGQVGMKQFVIGEEYDGKKEEGVKIRLGGIDGKVWAAFVGKTNYITELGFHPNEEFYEDFQETLKFRVLEDNGYPLSNMNLEIKKSEVKLYEFSETYRFIKAVENFYGVKFYEAQFNATPSRALEYRAYKDGHFLLIIIEHKDGDCRLGKEFTMSFSIKAQGEVLDKIEKKSRGNDF